MGNFLTASRLLVAVLVSISNAKPLSGNATQPLNEACGRVLLQDFDSLGAWFEGVNAISCTSVPRRDNVTIAIIGGGVSGLATGLMLDSIGMRNWEIIEASERVGGRFRTKFVGGTDEYAEMGPMRLPWSITYKSDNTTHEYTDHRMTFQLADTLNRLNGHDPRYKIDFIPWIQHQSQRAARPRHRPAPRRPGADPRRGRGGPAAAGQAGADEHGRVQGR
ncbi:L-amino-acid oxidase [Beauveria bassiana D1-5]|uniref:L-amino-acid oxidase n=1 Tax=Beauveria bassiana D1-5 TaxID=1245745 RepID=A0A0A2VUN6_BEABA|nr:L-amino-acid oxidase [Beauveria bassiana D1-5]